jgi:hypothetical protein
MSPEENVGGVTPSSYRIGLGGVTDRPAGNRAHCDVVAPNDLMCGDPCCSGCTHPSDPAELQVA